MDKAVAPPTLCKYQFVRKLNHNACSVLKNHLIRCTCAAAVKQAPSAMDCYLILIAPDRIIVLNEPLSGLPIPVSFSL
jgi:hypothetical protein